MKSLAELLPALDSLPDSDLELEQRIADAREIRDRLPRVFRHSAPREMASRVTHGKLRETAQAWQPEAGNVLFVGPTGIGKSTAAAYLFRRLLASGVKAGGADWGFARRMHWFASSDLARARREHPLGQGDAPEVIDACSASLVVLDDLGWERDVSVVAEILATRYESGAPTIATSGKTGPELADQYGAAVIRRLVESGGPGRGTIVDCFEATNG